MNPANDHQPRRGLSRVDAAGYIGVGVMLFDELVRDGRNHRRAYPQTEKRGKGQKILSLIDDLRRRPAPA